MQYDILFIINGGIAAHRCLEVVRELSRSTPGLHCKIIITANAAKFITPQLVSGLTGIIPRSELFAPSEEGEISHIELAHQARLIVVCPATANFIAKVAHGLADDLASTVMLASEQPALWFPAMNPTMWSNARLQQNIHLLKQDGHQFIQPVVGETACGEFGKGRLPENASIVAAIQRRVTVEQLLTGKRALVTAGPTRENIDGVRFLSNYSSGKQGYAIAASLANFGAAVTLVSGPSGLPTPAGVTRIDVTTGREMYTACQDKLPADIIIGCAAVADWYLPNPEQHKIAKHKGLAKLDWHVNQDIIASIAQLPSKSSTGSDQQRPALVIGFAAASQKLKESAKQKLKAKQLDLVLANLISKDVFGSDSNEILCCYPTAGSFAKAGLSANASSFVPNITIEQGICFEKWPRQTKTIIADNLSRRIAATLSR